MKTYVGTTTGTADTHVVEVHDDGQLVGLLAHHAKHSPTGFSWGYSGSGPADLARSILIDHLADGAWCPACAGTGRQIWNGDRFVPYDPDAYPPEQHESLGGCFECFGELTSFETGLYQRFKRDMIAPLPEDGRWEITADQIDNWLDRARGRGRL